MNGRGIWPVVATYLLAFAGIVAHSFVAGALVQSLYPDMPFPELARSLPGLLASAVASSTALLLTVVAVARPLSAARLRLRPGRERGLDLVAVIVGTLALGQALDALVTLTGGAEHGAMAEIRRALAGAAGGELLAAVLVIGLLAGAAEEVFFRGLLQGALRERLSPALAVLASAAGFGLMHLEWRHALLALALGLWLGAATEACGSALPAAAAHVTNNVVFTLATAVLPPVSDARTNAWLLAGALVVLAACVARLARVAPRPPAAGLRPVGPRE